MSSKSKVLKQYASLVKNITSFSDNQAFLSDNQPDEDSFERFNVTIAPRDGLYRHGKFEFEFDIADGYPENNPPRIRCLTKVYHPNIDQIDEYSEGDICLNLLDELWDPYFTLEDYVQGLLFMFYNPNFTDPLNPAFDGSEDESVLRANIRASMRGKDVDGMEYDNVLPDDYETDEDYEDNYTAIKTATYDSGDSDDEEDKDSDVSSVVLTNDKTLLPVIEECSETSSDLKYEVTPTCTPTPPEFNDTNTTNHPDNINIKPLSSLIAVITRVIRFLRPSVIMSNGNINMVALRYELSSVVVYGAAMIAFRLGLRILLRTHVINIVR